MKQCVFISLFLFFLPLIVKAQEAKWHFEFLPGTAYVLPVPLNIEQEGFDDIDITAHYRTNSFNLPIYYSVRIGYWKEQKGWELEMNHLKIYLKNRPEEIEMFSVSHGYNQLWINYAWQEAKFICRIGAGLVISHPESTINGLKFDQSGGLFNNGYFLSGFTLQGSVQKRWYVSEKLFFSAEAKLNAAWARVKVHSGHADVPQLSFHGLFGIGIVF